MKNLKVILGVILLSICGGIIARKMLWKTYKKHNGILNDYKKKLTIMGNLSKANLDYILKWEGGLSKHPRDSAARHPLPDGSGYHTNKGITWRVFVPNMGTPNKPLTDSTK
jgi:hypothetical protein